MVVVGLCRVEEIWVSGVHPPSVSPLVEQRFQVLPIDVAGLRRECVIHTHSRRIVHPWRPESQSALRPGLEVEKQAFLVELTVGFGLWSETGPDADHEVGVLLVHLINHPLAVGVFLSQEIHGVPQVVRAPILPVLDDAIERNLQLTVFIDHTKQFRSTLVAFLALPETVSPQWEHRHIARKMTHLGNHTVSRTAIHKIIVLAVAHLRGERHARRIVVELGA